MVSVFASCFTVMLLEDINYIYFILKARKERKTYNSSVTADS